MIVCTLLHSRNRTEAAEKLGMTFAQLRTTLVPPEIGQQCAAALSAIQ